MTFETYHILPNSKNNTIAWPIYSAEMTRLIESATYQALPPSALMQRAGKASAQLALAIAPHAATVHVFAGPGNNGGDGLATALHLQQAGKHVVVHLLGSADQLPADAKTAYNLAQTAGILITPLTTASASTLSAHDLAIDALLGLGINRSPEGRLAECICAINACQAPILALDLPSGLATDTGWVNADFGPTAPCIRATHTLSLLTLKAGLLTAYGRDYVGSLWFNQLNVATAAIPGSEPLAHLSTLRQSSPRYHNEHKGSFGSVAVIGGAPSMTGAAILAAKSALHTGTGRVYIQLLDPSAIPFDPTTPELMFRSHFDWNDPVNQKLVVVAGCGGSPQIGQYLSSILHSVDKLVLDADALNQIAQAEHLQTLLSLRRDTGQETILTPHPLEAARLLGQSDIQVIQSNRLAAAQQLAKRFNCHIVLKGSGTIIQAPHPRATYINPTGNPHLASAGTGDVLAGWIASLWAQGLSTLDAALQAVYRHGLAADNWCLKHPGQHFTASQLIS